MTGSTHAWWDFGYAGIFVCVFLEQIGVPIPAFPALLAAGTLVASGTLSLTGCLIVAVIAGLVADNIWYGIGRAKGTHVLHLMCRLSWKPDGCVGKTKGMFTQHGSKTLVFAKFVPGLSVLAPPLAGSHTCPSRASYFMITLETNPRTPLRKAHRCLLRLPGGPRRVDRDAGIQESRTRPCPAVVERLKGLDRKRIRNCRVGARLLAGDCGLNDSGMGGAGLVSQTHRLTDARSTKDYFFSASRLYAFVSGRGGPRRISIPCSR